MRIYGNYAAAMPCMIDFLEFEFPKVPDMYCPEDLDNHDVILSVDWDESDWDYDPESSMGHFRMKGVYLNQIYANKQLDVFKSAILDKIQVAGSPDADFVLTGLTINDGDESFRLPEEMLLPREIDYVD